jgi:hypothetical protein
VIPETCRPFKPIEEVGAWPLIFFQFVKPVAIQIYPFQKDNNPLLYPPEKDK